MPEDCLLLSHLLDAAHGQLNDLSSDACWGVLEPQDLLHDQPSSIAFNEVFRVFRVALEKIGYSKDAVVPFVSLVDRGRDLRL